MLITGNKISDDCLLEKMDADNIKGGCYYLRIHSIIPAGKAAEEYDVNNPLTMHTLEPGGLAWVISEEVFNIQKFSITALVTLRSSFTKKGMLALDVGLVDANYHGPIGTVVINFSKNRIPLNKGDKFFRVIFLEHDEATGSQKPPKVETDHKNYSAKQRLRMIRDFSETFLQTGEIEQKIKNVLSSTDVIKDIEADITRKLVQYILQKYGFYIFIGILILGAIGLWIFQANEFVLSKEDIEKLIRAAIKKTVE